MKKLNHKIKENILKMVSADKKMRRAFDGGKAFDSKLDKKHTNELKKIVEQYGWPTVSLVGRQASWGAWLLVQHADHDLDFQKKGLQLMEKAYKQKNSDVSLSNIAFLKDRILVNQGKKQLFGTQLVVSKNGQIKLGPVRELKKIDQRRLEYGLSPLKDYLESAKKYKPDRLQ